MTTLNDDLKNNHYDCNFIVHIGSNTNKRSIMTDIKKIKNMNNKPIFILYIFPSSSNFPHNRKTIHNHFNSIDNVHEYISNESIQMKYDVDIIDLYLNESISGRNMSNVVITNNNMTIYNTNYPKLKLHNYSISNSNITKYLFTICKKIKGHITFINEALFNSRVPIQRTPGNPRYYYIMTNLYFSKMPVLIKIMLKLKDIGKSVHYSDPMRKFNITQNFFRHIGKFINNRNTNVNNRNNAHTYNNVNTNVNRSIRKQNNTNSMNFEYYNTSSSSSS